MSKKSSLAKVLDNVPLEHNFEWPVCNNQSSVNWTIKSSLTYSLNSCFERVMDLSNSWKLIASSPSESASLSICAQTVDTCTNCGVFLRLTLCIIPSFSDFRIFPSVRQSRIASRSSWQMTPSSLMSVGKSDLSTTQPNKLFNYHKLGKPSVASHKQVPTIARER